MRRHLTRTFFHPWWRLKRGMTLGVRAIVADSERRVLLVRHSYVAGWHLPGGGVERGETLGGALARELREEANVELEEPARLHGIFCNRSEFPGDHVAVFVAGAWRQDGAPPIGLEIVETGFFHIGALPDGATPGTRRRIAEVFDGASLSETW